jgi:hypothetical protein
MPLETELEHPLLNKQVDPEIDLENPLSDLLPERREAIKHFNNLIRSIEQPYVISLDAPYGFGKSFFLERWQQQLKLEGEIALYFNAWANDYCNHPFIPFAVSVTEQLQEWNFKDQQLSSIVGRLKPAINNLVKQLPGFIAQTASAGALPKEVVDQTIEEIIKEPPALLTGDHYQIYKDQTSNLTAFKNTLKEIIEEIRVYDDSQKKIYIFVDELERCRPTFAVELLEQIKHIFDIKGIVFIVATDKSQLKHTISGIYGQGMNSEGYLSRFFDFPLSLPEIDRHAFLNLKFNDIYGSQRQDTGDFYTGIRHLSRYLCIFSKYYDLSLRDFLKVAHQSSTIIRLNEQLFTFPVVLAFLLVINVANHSLFNSLGKKEKEKEIIDSIEKSNIRSYMNIKEYEIFLAFLYVALDSNQGHVIGPELTKINARKTDMEKNDTQMDSETEFLWNTLNSAKRVLGDLEFKMHIRGSIANWIKSFFKYIPAG